MLRASFLVTFASSALFAGGTALGAAAPYFQDFDSYEVGNTTTEFIESPTSATTIVQEGSSDRALSTSISGTGSSVATAAVSITGLSTAPGEGFIYTSEFRPTALTLSTGSSTGATINMGLAALGATSNLNAGTEYRILYFASAGSAGKISIQEGGTTRQTSIGSIPFALDTLYTLTLTGTYGSAGELNLVASLVNTVTTTPITVAYLDDTPQAGTFFGYRTALNAGTGATTAASTTVNYDNFDIKAVPEPAAGALLLAAGMVVAARRRRFVA